MNDVADLPRVTVVVLSHRFDLAIDAMKSVKAQSYPESQIDLRLEHALDYYPDKFNNAWAGTRGKYLVFLPDDDTLCPEFITRHVEEAERADADLVFSDFYVTGRLTMKWHLPTFDSEILRMYAVPWMTFLVKREFWASLPQGTRGECGGWDGDQVFGDWDAGIRMYRHGAKTVQLRNEYLWNRSEHKRSASFLAQTPEMDAALVMLRKKHSAMAIPFAATQEDLLHG